MPSQPQDLRIRLRRLHEAFKKVLDKTFEEIPFETFLEEFGEECSTKHRDYLFELYNQLISMTRSNTEEEFGVIVFQADLEDKLARLQSMIASQPEAGGGVTVSELSPEDLARKSRMDVKNAEKKRLVEMLAALDQDNDQLRPKFQSMFQEVTEAQAALRMRKESMATMLTACAGVGKE
ncbi:hypothetical protein GUITHDRAFT_119927 [Guillardia theta CCMP2712]|uniref:Uncharacterized protein n=2 Tax=Guillardia theta TaxID=55529 RepID=L1ICT2_GUITC|nr:hypothetical protein GUITHDRAFT_119927 [Guillardia theta CCMP2712]EKX33882.1 hypothetical protein GUITHDRAFT_119927 [Guillardia theta CCMP2712]|mmetsp:Transcript_5113/g.18355  ORF Transcript_5113/g.18355 Transcript_5113/m.18355 type:complete len:179 (+) Transcript_5113:20-556(+)|eukprot:XP_005820862.1 hypothetical protein GUITHDRAFT_119927 [Guillardia theta CCMP2712]